MKARGVRAYLPEQSLSLRAIDPTGHDIMLGHFPKLGPPISDTQLS